MLTELEQELLSALRAMLDNCYDTERNDATAFAVASAQAAITHAEAKDDAFFQQTHRVKLVAYTIDPECWISYSGQPKQFKRAMDARRNAALRQAAAREDD
jgi:hypothetical protein